MMFCKTHVANYLLLAKRAAIVLKFVHKRRQNKAATGELKSLRAFGLLS